MILIQISAEEMMIPLMKKDTMLSEVTGKFHNTDHMRFGAMKITSSTVMGIDMKQTGRSRLLQDSIERERYVQVLQAREHALQRHDSDFHGCFGMVGKWTTGK